MNEARLRQVVRRILREEIGRNYHTVDPTPNTWDTFEDFEIEYYPQDTGEYLMDISFKGKKLIPTTRFGSYADAENYARRVVDKCRVEWMNSVQAKNESIVILGQLIRETLLQERVFGAQAFVYHGSSTPPDVWIPAISRDEFKPGGGDMYGKGLYTVYDLDKTQTSEGGYGKYVYKLKVNLYGFVIFDKDVAMKVYGQALTPRQQILKLGLDDLAEFVPESFSYDKFTSADALNASKNLKGQVKGLVFTGRQDGRVAVIYDPSAVVPVSWREAVSKNPNDWNVVSRKQMRPAVQRSAAAAGEFETERFDFDPVDKLKSLEKLPPGRRIVKGDLNLRYTDITSLPAGLKVGGDLNLRYTPITSLPAGLKVRGYLRLDGTQITSLPAGLKVGGALYLMGARITSLPADLEVGGTLYLNNTLITSLPAGLKVGDNLDLRYTKITSLPTGLKVGGSLYLEGTRITSLPDDLEVGGLIRDFPGDKNSIPAHLRSKLA